MLKAKNLQIGNTLVSAALDGGNNRIHILDLDKGMSLTNALNGHFCQRVLDLITSNLWVEVEDYEIICYHTDSMISLFDTKKENFQFLSPHDERVDKEFTKEMFYLYGC